MGLNQIISWFMASVGCIPQLIVLSWLEDFLIEKVASILITLLYLLYYMLAALNLKTLLEHIIVFNNRGASYARTWA